MPRVNRRQFLQSAAAAAAGAAVRRLRPDAPSQRGLRAVGRPALGLHGRRRASVPQDAQHRPARERGHPVLERVLHQLAVLAEPRQLPERALRAQPSGHQQLHRVPEPTSRAIRSACTTTATTRRTSASGTWARATTRSARDSTTGPATRGRGRYYDTPFNVDGQRQVIKGYYAHVVTNLATEWLKTARRPFSLTVGHKAPHGLWIPEPKYEHAFDNVVIRKPETAVPGPGTPDWVSRRIKTWHGIDGPLYGSKDFDTFIRTYHETILSVDDSVGQIYEALRAMGELDNTIFLFAGDNGFLLGEHASIDKRTMWEESIRIPLLVRYPDAMRDARVVDRMVLNLDVAPSVLDLCGAAAAHDGARRFVQGPRPGEGRGMADFLDVRVQLREGVPVHPQRTRRANRRVELHALSERRGATRHREGGALQRQDRSAREEQPDRRP